MSHSNLQTPYGYYDLYAVVTILIHDIIETLDKEITYIWKLFLSLSFTPWIDFEDNTTDGSFQVSVLWIGGAYVFEFLPKQYSAAAFSAPELIFQSILVLVIIITIIRHQKTWTLREQTSLTTIIIRDGLWGYFFNLFGLLIIIIQPILLSGLVGQLSLQWSYVTFSVTSSRLLLNLRSCSRNTGVSDMTSLSFIGNRLQTDREMDFYSESQHTQETECWE
ncbi:hypothetical protein Clacol_009732 [Clathrus columnatus]|uniref:Uncharacterized protein n=1 Tax=Clathrus columnatus TaxID=1419009 RepID=A0AAV5AQL8_9AGAM|nr:hypothetical protein Clacol_009732 [Clathrus columnatus]